MPEKIVGILGGMGPEATVDIFYKILKATPAKNDQEHLRILIDCNSKIPDRTNFLLNNGDDPQPFLVESAKLLEKAGAEMLVIPCNTAHYWYEEIKNSVNIPVMHIMEAALEDVTHRFPGTRKMGLLATSLTAKVGLYKTTFAKKRIEVISPDQDDQEIVMKAIREIKAGNRGMEITRALVDVSEHLISRGAQGIIAGCTEIPLALTAKDLTVPIIDSTHALAVVTVREARGNQIGIAV